MTTLIIVARDRPELFTLFTDLADRMAGEPRVHVIFDRRELIAPPGTPERRQEEAAAKEIFGTVGYIIVKVP